MFAEIRCKYSRYTTPDWGKVLTYIVRANKSYKRLRVCLYSSGQVLILKYRTVYRILKY